MHTPISCFQCTTQSSRSWTTKFVVDFEKFTMRKRKFTVFDWCAIWQPIACNWLVRNLLQKSRNSIWVKAQELMNDVTLSIPDSIRAKSIDVQECRACNKNRRNNIIDRWNLESKYVSIEITLELIPLNLSSFAYIQPQMSSYSSTRLKNHSSYLCSTPRSHLSSYRPRTACSLCLRFHFSYYSMQTSNANSWTNFQCGVLLVRANADYAECNKKKCTKVLTLSSLPNLWRPPHWMCRTRTHRRAVVSTK